MSLLDFAAAAEDSTTLLINVTGVVLIAPSNSSYTVGWSSHYHQASLPSRAPTQSYHRFPILIRYMLIDYISTTPSTDSQFVSDDSECITPKYQECRNCDPTAGSHSPEVPTGRLIDDGPSDTHSLAPGLCQRLFQMARSSPQSSLVASSCAPRPIPTGYQATISTPEIRRRQIETQAKHDRIKVSKVQLGVWYKQTETVPSQGRTFSIEYERDFLRGGLAYIHLVYEHDLIRIDIIRKINEDRKYFISVKFSSIRNLGIGYDEFGRPFILFDLHTPPSFEVQCNGNRAPDGTERRWAHKTYDRLSALDDAHARVAPYAHHLRVILPNRDDLLKFEQLCHISEGHFRPVRVSHVDALSRGFFSGRHLRDVHRWIKTMDWKNAFQIEAYLRYGLLNTQDLLFALQQPIESVVRDYGDNASELLRFFSVALRTRSTAETPSACLARVRSEHPIEAIKPLKVPHGRVLCHHIVITPTRILPEGPYIVQSNRVIRYYQNHDPTLAERFVYVEFREEDNLPYRWDGEVDGSWFLRHRVGGILRDGFELGGCEFEFLAYSMTSLHRHAAWFIAPFRDPVEGYANAEKIRASLGDFSQLERLPSKYAARIAQAFTATEPSVKLRRGQWEEQEDLGPHTDGMGTISPDLADMIWVKSCCAAGNLKESRVKPSAYQFCFLGYRGVVVVDHRLGGIRLRLRRSQRKFSVHNVDEAEFEIVRLFDHPDPAYLNRPLIMTLEDLGVKAGAFIELQDAVKAQISSASDSLEDITRLLKTYTIGRSFHLAFLFNQLTKLGLGPRDSFEKIAFGNAFLGRLLHGSAQHMLRELKYKAQIPVPKSYQLVGVADEGQSYIKEGMDPGTVFTLKEGFIYVCVQEAVDKEPVYLKGPCVICRNPVLHPGDVQRVYAVGMPPEDKICFFHGLKNVIVLPAVGDRSLASCLSEDNVDGNTYNIYFGNWALLPTVQAAPADYPPGPVWVLDEGHDDVVIDHVHDFVVKFMMSDTVGLVADCHMVIADQSMDGIFDERCIHLARLCRMVTDHAMNGIAIEIDNHVPQAFIKSMPDWHCPEVPSPCHVDYYESGCAIGHLFRNVNMHELPDRIPVVSPGEARPLEDVISRALAPLVQSALDTTIGSIQITSTRAEDLHAWYASEMRFICLTHSMSTSPNACLSEEEVVLGTIMGKCSQSHWRTDRADRMRMHTEALVSNLRGQISTVRSLSSTAEDLYSSLWDAWAIWSWAQHHREELFIQSFSLVALGLIFELLELFEVLPSL